MQKMKIDIRSFREWQDHLVTKAFFEFLGQERVRIKEAMSHPHVIFDDSGNVRNNLISRLSGELGFIEGILEIEYESLNNGENNENS